jgi:hypothetical protein
MIPSGESGMLLVIRQNGKTLEEKIMVKISQREVPK